MKKKRTKNNLPFFESDDDFLDAFAGKDSAAGQQLPSGKTNRNKSLKGNEKDPEEIDEMDEKAFSEMLEASFKNMGQKKLKKPAPLPLKKRLKRYPPAELDLDLHGFNAIGALVKVKSFVQSAKYQGYFTVRIIVGKGLHSEHGAVLPDVVEDELKRMKKQDLIIHYEWERKKKSSSGAVIVYLKQFEEYD